MLEAAITLPLILFLTLLVVQWALVWHARHVAEAAAQDGLRVASSYQATPQDGRTAALEYLGKVAPRLLPSPAVSVTANATSVTVTVQARPPSVLSFAPVTVRESVSGPRERFVTPGQG